MYENVLKFLKIWKKEKKENWIQVLFLVLEGNQHLKNTYKRRRNRYMSEGN